MAVSPAVIKAIATAATDKRTWKALAILLAAIFMPLILMIVMIAGMVSGVESANNNLLDYSFAGAEIPAEFTDEQRGAIEDMREWLDELNDIISEKENDEECSLDGDMVRAAFYCLNFGGKLGEDFDFEAFCECCDDRMIEPIGYLHDPDAIMVGNEEAKLIGMDALSAYGGKRCNRRFLEGIVAGPFFICGDDGEDFCSLSDEKCEEYLRVFAEPHTITQEEVEQDMRIDLIGF